MPANTNPQETNPFLQDDAIVPVLLQNKQFQQSSSYALRNYQSNNSTQLQSNIFMSMLYKLTHLTTTAITALVTLFTITGGATLTQVYAQEQYKPLTLAKNALYGANKQSDPEPKVALLPDENTYLVFIEPCDLAVKYPKKVSGFDIQYQEDTYSNGDKAGGNFTATDQELGVSCPSEIYFDTYNNYTSNTEKISIEKLREATGWFTTQTDLQNIEWKSFYEDGKFVNKSLNFEYNNRYYSFATNYEPTKLSDFANIQVQFKVQLNDKSKEYAINNKPEKGNCGDYKFNSTDYETSYDSISNNYKERSIINTTPKKPELYNNLFIDISCSNKIEDEIKSKLQKANNNEVKKFLLGDQNSKNELYYNSIEGTEGKQYFIKNEDNNWISAVFRDKDNQYIDYQNNAIPQVLN